MWSVPGTASRRVRKNLYEECGDVKFSAVKIVTQAEGYFVNETNEKRE